MENSVLIADDSSSMRMIIEKSILISGLAVKKFYKAGNDEEAYQLLGAHAINWAFIDLNMPVGGGWVLIEKIKQNAAMAHLKLVVVSAESAPEQIKKVQAMGIPFIHKPFSPQQLKQVILEAREGDC